MGCKISGCPRTVFNKQVNLCFEHLQEHFKRSEQKEVEESVKQERTQNPSRTQKDLVVHKKRGRPKKNNHCIKCSEPLSKHSASYCKEHEKERLKEWRKKNTKLAKA